MKKLTPFVLLCLVTLNSQGLTVAQDTPLKRPASINATSSEREQDGLNGPVRRVRVESAKIIVKEGKPVEGGRVVRGITTYDLEGRRIDAVAYPVENTTMSGKEEYRYDDQGNIIEMVLRGENGVILTKELYQYEFDELGNWKKMTTSVAVYENGKLGSEPMEVTYRVLTYYYSQAIDKIGKPTAANTNSASRTTANQVSQKKGESRPAKTSPPAQEKSTEVSPQTDSRRQPRNSAKRVVPAENGTNLTAKMESAKPSATPAPRVEPPVEKEKKEVKRVASPTTSGNESAANNRAAPAPTTVVTSEAPADVRTDDKRVASNESASKTAAKATATPAPTVEVPRETYTNKTLASESVNKTPAKSTPTPAPVIEVPRETNSNKTVASESASKAPPKSAPTPAPVIEAPRETNPNAASGPSRPSDNASSYYEHGVSYLKTGKYSDAVVALKQAVFVNPEDALAYMKLGLAYAALNQHQEALAVFKLAIRIKPEVMDAEAYYRMAESFTAAGKPSDALKSYKQALYTKRAEVVEGNATGSQKFPTLADLQFGLGLAYYNMESFTDAIRELKQATVLEPTSAEAHYGLALAYIGKGDRGAAQKEERILRPLDAAMADNVAAALSTVLPRGVTRVAPREDRRTRP